MAWVEARKDGFRVRYRLPDGELYTENGFASREDADNRAADIESDQRRSRFIDPRLAQTTVDEWIRVWSDAHHVSTTTWSTYDSHIRNHILPRWTGTALGDVQRMLVKSWANKTLRPSLADKSVQDIIILFSMILGEAVDEGLIGANPCRKLRLNFAGSPERPHASGDEVDAIAGRMPPPAALMTITAAYTGMRWGELAGLQWRHTHLDGDPRIEIDPDTGALHETRTALELGPPKTPASIRTVHLPPFLVGLLAEHREHDHHPRFVFAGRDGALQRRSNFRRRFWLPALAGDEELGWAPVQPTMHFHDLRHTHKTWLIEDGVPRVVQLQRLGHKPKDASDRYSHVTRPMIDAMLTGLETRWAIFGTWSWIDFKGSDPIGNEHVVTDRCSPFAPHIRKRPTDEDHRQAV